MKFLYDPIKGLNTYPPPPGVVISQPFGTNPHIYAQFGHKGHNGWDIAAPRGTPIMAMQDGFIVEQTHRETGYGLRISQRIEYDGKLYSITYGHMERLERDQSILWDWNYKGYPVVAGQVIGYVDSTGFSTGHHLHFTVQVRDKFGNVINSNNGYGGALDPEPMLLNKEAPPMRLVNDNGTVFIVGEKGRKIGLADEGLLAALKEIAPLEKGSTSSIPQVRVIETTRNTFVVKNN